MKLTGTTKGTTLIAQSMANRIASLQSPYDSSELDDRQLNEIHTLNAPPPFMRLRQPICHDKTSIALCGKIG